MRKAALITLIVICSASIEAATPAWTVGSQPTTASYTPPATRTFNPANGPVTITRSQAGLYLVRFGGLAPLVTGGNGNVQVSPMSTLSGQCSVAGFNSSGTDVVITIRCYITPGAHADVPFSLLFTYK